MAPRKAENFSTPSPQELQELYDLPTEIKQCDLGEILEAQYRVRVAREDLLALWAQLETQVALGLRVEAGKLSILTGVDGRRKIIEGEEETLGRSQDSIPF